MLRKLSVGGYLDVLAALLGALGTVLTIVSATMSSDNGLAGLPMIAAAGFAGVALCALAVWAPARFGNFDVLGTVSIWGAIALYCYTFGAALGQRVMLIAGLFSYNSGNTLGWSVFYVSLGAWGCLLAGCLALIVSGFLRTVRQGA